MAKQGLFRAGSVKQRNDFKFVVYHYTMLNHFVTLIKHKREANEGMTIYHSNDVSDNRTKKETEGVRLLIRKK